MSYIKDVVVNISRETQALTQKGFGLPLILATNVDHEYKEYLDLQSVSDDFKEDTEAYKMANRIFAQTPRPEKIAIYGVAYDSTAGDPKILTAALNDLAEKNNDWYFLLCEEKEDTEITALSGWIDAQKKLYFADTDNLSLAATLESERTIICVHTKPEEYMACGWVGKCGPKDPGSLTWKFKNINGVTEADLGVTEITQLHKDGGNTYVRKLGMLQTSEGKVSSGEYIDVMRSQDFIEARMTEEVSRLLYTKDKIPYSNKGISMVVDAMTTVLKQATEQGIILTDENDRGVYSINVPTRGTIPINDVANRKLNGVEWCATLAGAIHEITINGVLTYEEV
ncbi:DUF3383 family protein [Dethiothermospora halolimnae]|uniref:DUF3383 family protein n=1 Tax=Dethiothermospora halolimnae TaxID=3114390 RepID=UPI003CCBBA6E